MIDVGARFISGDARANARGPSWEQPPPSSAESLEQMGGATLPGADNELERCRLQALHRPRREDICHA